MAQLSPETTAIVNQLKQQSLAIVDMATAVAFSLLESFGETEETLPFFDELQTVHEDARDSFAQLNRFLLQIAEAQPIASVDVLKLLSYSIEITTSRIPAWQRSIEEVKLEFDLP
jgi:hypothetical protein